MSMWTGDSYAYFNNLDNHPGGFNTARAPEKGQVAFQAADTRIVIGPVASGESPGVERYAMRVAAFERAKVLQGLVALGAMPERKGPAGVVRFRDPNGLGVELKHSACLQLAAQLCGFKDWYSYLRHDLEQPLSPLDEELSEEDFAARDEFQMKVLEAAGLGAVAREEQVGVGVHEARQHRPAARVDPVVSGGCFAGFTGPHDAVAVDDDGRVLDQTERGVSPTLEFARAGGPPSHRRPGVRHRPLGGRAGPSPRPRSCHNTLGA